METTLVTETSEVKTQTPGKFPEESTLESQSGENLKTNKNISYHIPYTPPLFSFNKAQCIIYRQVQH
jgi:hypothetical protein